MHRSGTAIVGGGPDGPRPFVSVTWPAWAQCPRIERRLMMSLSEVTAEVVCDLAASVWPPTVQPPWLVHPCEQGYNPSTTTCQA
jgi:hypothetical protein